jgi:hypothetical protein
LIRAGDAPVVYLDDEVRQSLNRPFILRREDYRSVVVPGKFINGSRQRCQFEELEAEGVQIQQQEARVSRKGEGGLRQPALFDRHAIFRP